jgi:hypothetical protein
LRSVNSIDEKTGNSSRATYVCHCSFKDLQQFSYPWNSSKSIIYTCIIITEADSLLPAVIVVSAVIKTTMSIAFIIPLTLWPDVQS